MQITDLNQLILQVYGTYKKDEKVAAKFEASNPEDVINKAHLDEKLFKKTRSFITIRKRLQRI